MYKSGQGALSLVIPAKVNGQAIRAVVDTAAQVTVVSNDFARTMEHPMKYGENIALKGAGKASSIQAKYAPDVNITIGNTTTPWNVVVTAISDPFALGLDFLRAHRAKVDMDQLKSPSEGSLFQPPL